MPRMPRVTGAEVLRALRSLGWVVAAQRGSHVQLKRPDRPGRVTIPIHAGETVEEAMERAAEAISVHIAGLEADGEVVPEEREPPRLVTVTVAA